MRELAPLELELRGRHVIEASAGTGKTYTLTSLVLRLVVERGLGLDEILVVTFTNAASAELRERIRRRIAVALRAFQRGGDSRDAFVEALVARHPAPQQAIERLKAASTMADEAAVFTIHGFCQRVLQEHAFESGMPFDTELVTDARPLQREVASDLWSRMLCDAPPECVRFFVGQRLTLRDVARLVTMVTADPELPIVVGAEQEHPEAAVAQYAQLRARTREAWASARSSVLKLLASGALGRNRYPLKSIANWERALSRQLERDDATLEGSGPHLERFTPSALERATRKGQATPQHEFFVLCASLLDAENDARAALSGWHMGLLRRLVEQARAEMVRRRAQLGIRTFDDLLNDLRAALVGASGEGLARALRRRFPAALIDEFQDTDPIQYEIFDRIYAGRDATLLFIGDPKQAIYGFRGADIYAYIRAVRDWGHAPWTLTTNYRSDRGLVEGVNALFSQTERPFLLSEIAFEKVRASAEQRAGLRRSSGSAAPIEILVATTEGAPGARGRLTKSQDGDERVPRIVARDIARMLDEGATVAGRALRPGDIAVLTRTNRQAQRVQSELARVGVPAVRHGDASVFDSDEAKSMLQLLAGVLRPSVDAAVRTALVGPLFQLDARAIFGLEQDERAREAWVEQFSAWRRLWLEHGVLAALRCIFTEQDCEARLLGQLGGERVVTNFLHLGQLLHGAELELGAGPERLRDWLRLMVGEVEARQGVAAETHQLRLETDSDAVTLTTVHRSKGLEYPVVYCPYLWEGVTVARGDEQLLCYHDPSDDFRLKLDLRPKTDKAEALAERLHQDLAEALRLTYVALTRAKHRTTLVWGWFNHLEQSPLAHLLHHGFRGHHGEGGPEKLDEERGRAQLEELAQHSGGSIAVRDADEGAVARWQPARRSREWRGAREVARALRMDWRASSFSALVAHDTPLSEPVALGLDRDEEAAVPPLPLGAEQRGPPAPPRDGSAEVVPLREFPRGPGPGVLLHELFEHADFQALDGEAHERRVRGALERRGYDVERWQGPLQEMMKKVASAPLLPEQHWRLGELPRARRLNELEFQLPLGAPGCAPWSADALADAFARHGDGAIVRGYAERLRTLGFRVLAGYLSGFIDLAFEAEGRWYVVDYKSNDLGPTYAHYAPAELARPMLGHHYLLQYHLYSVALHRWLQTRLPGYDYDEHFGGALYLFLRGISPEREAGHGIWFDRPPRALVEAISSLCGPTRLPRSASVDTGGPVRVDEPPRGDAGRREKS